MDIYEQIGRNKKSSQTILIVFIAFFVFIGAGLDYYYGAGIKAPAFTLSALIISGIAGYCGYRYGDRLVLSATRARELDTEDYKQKQWQNVVGEMSIAAGIPLPKMYIVDDPDPNAFATGRDPAHASIAVTRGLLDALDRDELQAVASHEMSHIRNYDIRLMLVVAVLVGSVALISDWAQRGLFRGNKRSDRRSGGSAALVLFVIWAVAVTLAPILSRLMAMCVSRKREYLADASGAELTRNPASLASALAKISSASGPTRSINKGTAHLCICDPSDAAVNSREGQVADLFATHPPVGKRIEILRNMAYLKAS